MQYKRKQYSGLLNGENYEEDFEEQAHERERAPSSLSTQLGVSDAPSETQEQRQERELNEARSAAERQNADSKAQSERALYDTEQKAAASRAAAEQSRLSAQTLKDNGQSDLTSSGDPIVVAGGSAQSAAIDDISAKKKVRGGGISAQVGINV